MSIVSQNVERIIREKGLQKSTVAREAGITPRELSAMLHGRKLIMKEHIVPLSAALGCTPNELFGFYEGG